MRAACSRAAILPLPFPFPRLLDDALRAHPPVCLPASYDTPALTSPRKISVHYLPDAAFVASGQLDFSVDGNWNEREKEKRRAAGDVFYGVYV